MPHLPRHRDGLVGVGRCAHTLLHDSLLWFSAGLLVPWTAGLLWLGIFAALASFANLCISGPDGGQRRLAVALKLAAGFAASQVSGNKLLSLLPAALVAFALWQTGRSVAPAAIFAGAVIWSVVDRQKEGRDRQKKQSRPAWRCRSRS